MQSVYGVYAVGVLLILFITIYALERSHHEKRLQTIPTRIWINGSRGKSSVTRLIAAGLRSGGMQVIAKTTGTAPRFIVNNNTEIPITRLGHANIREQMTTVKTVRDYDAQALVFECMALRPDLQRIESRQIVKPGIVVITNVRPDHLDVMGPTLHDIRMAYLNALPSPCTVFTTDAHLAQRCEQKEGIQCILVTQKDKEPISTSTIKRFTHIEHKENVALALSVCQYCGINRQNALDSMVNALADPGALRTYDLSLNRKKISLIFAMAANDPESTRLIWESTDADRYNNAFVLINCRKDRIDRSMQFIRLTEDVFHNVTGFILTGAVTRLLVKKLARIVDPEKIFDVGNKTTEQASSLIIERVPHNSVIFAVGNTVGYGMELTQTLVQRGTADVD